MQKKIYMNTKWCSLRMNLFSFRYVEILVRCYMTKAKNISKTFEYCENVYLL